jgi:hypothetical protein
VTPLDSLKFHIHALLDDVEIRTKVQGILQDDHRHVDEYNEAESATDLELSITTQAELLVETIITESSASSATLWLGRRSFDVNQGTVEISRLKLRLAPGERRGLVATSAGRLRLLVIGTIIPTPVPNRKGQ